MSYYEVKLVVGGKLKTYRYAENVRDALDYIDVFKSDDYVGKCAEVFLYYYEHDFGDCYEGCECDSSTLFWTNRVFAPPVSTPEPTDTAMDMHHLEEKG